MEMSFVLCHCVLKFISKENILQHSHIFFLVRVGFFLSYCLVSCFGFFLRGGVLIKRIAENSSMLLR